MNKDLLKKLSWMPEFIEHMVICKNLKTGYVPTAPVPYIKLFLVLSDPPTQTVVEKY